MQKSTKFSPRFPCSCFTKVFTTTLGRGFHQGFHHALLVRSLAPFAAPPPPSPPAQPKGVAHALWAPGLPSETLHLEPLKSRGRARQGHTHLGRCVTLRPHTSSAGFRPGPFNPATNSLKILLLKVPLVVCLCVQVLVISCRAVRSIVVLHLLAPRIGQNS